ncbi:hypothetical protein E2C01_034044 [Portunus trituberculatus]|uniref:Uncharacterized protein n=1 Tax=Portunus trituberculatus TaxID=210409 RepID=A0A5B7F7F9_PORTR|nr:hypothetical protein [Portunus trituberculatus]
MCFSQRVSTEARWNDGAARPLASWWWSPELHTRQSRPLATLLRHHPKDDRREEAVSSFGRVFTPSETDATIKTVKRKLPIIFVRGRAMLFFISRNSKA